MIETITIKSLLPSVFSGMEETQKISTSQIWEVQSFSFHKGCRICLQAESGSGKTSLLSFIYGNRNDYLGEIFFDKKNIRTLTVAQWCEVRTNAISLLQQDMGLFPELTVIQNIDLKNNLTNYKNRQQILELLEMVGLIEKIDVPLGKLSVGQMQRVAFVRALCQPFDFIFLDEPVSHLDLRNNKIIADIVSQEAALQGAGVISTSVGNPLLLDNAQIISL